jgi:predicted ATP-grasp superfamily ATP-dependent carboligase
MPISSILAHESVHEIVRAVIMRVASRVSRKDTVDGPLRACPQPVEPTLSIH